MAIDQNQHVSDVDTGFIVDKDSGHLVGIEQAPVVPSPVDQAFPKWVKAEDSQVFRKQVPGYPDVISTPNFADYHVNRDTGEVTVLVTNEDEESIATSAYKKPDPLEDHAEPVVENPVLESIVEVKDVKPLQGTESSIVTKDRI